jgi:hypothetical protein
MAGKISQIFGFQAFSSVSVMGSGDIKKSKIDLYQARIVFLRVLFLALL